jgi:dipeptidyl aminopeptidase/acylaminoacyl peptidase
MSAEQSTPSDLPTIPYGAWPSPVDAKDLVTGASQPTDVYAERGITWWSQTRPDQGGRQQIVRRDLDGSVHDVFGPDWNARTRVHEYGGAAWWVHDGVVFSVDWSDQRLYRAEPGAEPVALTPEPPTPAAWRYADGRVTPDGSTVICVREAHEGAEVRNEIVALAAVPAGAGPARPRVLVTGPDFVAAPRISADGTQLAWFEWEHPNMPWDSTRLWIGELVPGSEGLELRNATLVAGTSAFREGESLIQPEWGPDGGLYVISDRSQWWNVYRIGTDADPLVPVHPVRAEVGQPPWIFGLSRYAPGTDAVWFTYSSKAGAHLVRVEPDGSARDDVLPFLSLSPLRLDQDDPAGERIVAIASQSTTEAAIIEIRREHGHLVSAVLNEPAESGLPDEAISIPRSITFPSADGRTAHAVFYPPVSTLAQAPTDEKPPLLVMIHGGPTSSASPAFRLSNQYWTSRGFAVVDVDYGGSTGYGRAYRQLLDDAWGIVDVEDAAAAAAWLGEQGLVDPARLAIRGGSAGGFTTLAALATTDVFAAGASHFGVADLAALARDTHKFESRYLDGLVGPWPAADDVYTARSPLSHIDGFDRPLIVLQGDEDAVVPPAQAELIVEALAQKQVPHAYLLFAGEQHGFRKADSIIRALEAELSFYGQVFGFQPAGKIEPVEIRFAEKL